MNTRYDAERPLEEYMQQALDKFAELRALMPRFERAVDRYCVATADVARVATFKAALLMAAQSRAEPEE